MNEWIKTSLEPHQAEAVSRGIKYTRYVYAFDAGRGKTLAALATFAEVRLKDPFYMCVVLCPKSAVSTWTDEIKKHSHFTSAENKLTHEADVNIMMFSQVSKNLGDLAKLVSN